MLEANGVLAVVALLALVLRVLRLDFQPLWWDEGYSIWFATHPLAQMAALTAEDIHPPFYYALLHFWTRLLGAGPVALRLLSVVFGVAAVPAIYLVGRRLLSGRAALLAALFLAINPFHVFYSQEVRMYGLMALLSIGVVAAAWGMFARESVSGRARAAQTVAIGGADTPTVRAAWPSMLLYILFTTAALYTQYYAVFLPIGLTIYALWRWRPRGGASLRDGRALLRWLGAQAAAAILYLPWVLYAAPRLVPYVSQKVVQDADRPLGIVVYFGRHLAAFLAGHLEGPLAGYWPVALVLLAPLGVGLGIRYWRSIPTPSSTSLLSTVLATAFLLGWLIGLRYPFFPGRGERLLLLALPPFVLLVAASVDALWERSRAVGYGTLALIGLVAAASLSAFYTVPRYATDDYRPLIARTVEQGLPEDTVFCVYPWQVGYWRSYGHPTGPTAVLTPGAAWSSEVASALDKALARGHVWFPAHLALGAILETQVETYLGERAIPFAVAWYGPGTRLSAWATTGDALRPVDAGPVRFLLTGASIPAVELTGVAVAPGPVPAANAVLPLALSWQAAAELPVLGVSVRLVDAIGQIWAQHDYESLGRLNGLEAHPSAASSTLLSPRSESAQDAGNPAEWRGEDHLGLLIPVGTPPGAYTLEVVVHLRGNARPLDAFGADGKSLGTAARITEVTIAPADRALGPERLPIATRQSVDLGDSLRLLGYTADAKPVATGELRKVSLFWQATGKPSAGYVAFLQLLDGSGGVTAGWEAPPGAAYPTDQWAPGTLIRTQAYFRPPATLRDGRYRLIAGLFRASDKVRLRTTAGADHISLGTVMIRGRPHDMTPPKPQHTLDVRLGPFARLAGYDLESPAGGLRPGGAFPLTLYWQATGTTDRAYTVFVHLVDEAGDTRGYGDAEPGGGGFSTASWLPGEYLADRHEVGVALDAPPGRYRLVIGLYDPATGLRLTTPDGADQVMLDVAVSVDSRGNERDS